MHNELARNWWLIALRGMLAIAFGVLAVLWPGFLWLTIVYLFAVYALIDGGMAIATVIQRRGQLQLWWALLLEGLIGITAGILALAWPGITELVLLYVIAGWSVATGVFEMLAAWRLRKLIRGEWLLALSGALSVVFGFLLAFLPIPGLIVIAWWVAAYWISFGTLMLILAFRLHKHAGARIESSADMRTPRMTPRGAGGASAEPGV